VIETNRMEDRLIVSYPIDWSKKMFSNGLLLFFFSTNKPYKQQMRTIILRQQIIIIIFSYSEWPCLLRVLYCTLKEYSGVLGVAYYLWTFPCRVILVQYELHQTNECTTFHWIREGHNNSLKIIRNKLHATQLP
jgi:hypothetical protein